MKQELDPYNHMNTQNKQFGMLKALHDAKKNLPSLLSDESAWKSVFVDYHPPYVERLWLPWNGYRIYLHRIHPCKEGKALFHPHPWASAMSIEDGRYEMAVGYGAGDIPPSIAATIILPAGSEYEMTDPDGWHYVRPLDDKPAISMMITGTPWDRPSPKSDKPLGPLAENDRQYLFEFFKDRYSAA